MHISVSISPPEKMNPTPEVIKKVITDIFESMGFKVEKVSMNNIGRPRAVYSVKNVLGAYQNGQSITSIASELNISKGTVWTILKRENVRIRNAGKFLPKTS